MARYIDADALVNRLKEIKLINFARKVVIAADEDYIVKILDAYPAADVAPVVRCKDCKHNLGVDSDGWVNCKYHGAYMASENEFCSRGVRRTHDET